MEQHWYGQYCLAQRVPASVHSVIELYLHILAGLQYSDFDIFNVSAEGFQLDELCIFSGYDSAVMLHMILHFDLLQNENIEEFVKFKLKYDVVVRTSLRSPFVA